MTSMFSFIDMPRKVCPACFSRVSVDYSRDVIELATISVTFHLLFPTDVFNFPEHLRVGFT